MAAARRRWSAAACCATSRARTTASCWPAGGPSRRRWSSGRADYHGARVMPRRVLSASMFFPRGGSAHVLRSLAMRLPDEGWDVTVLSGSRRDAGGYGDARRFYRGLDLREVDFSAALEAPDPLDPPGTAPPMHP